MNAFWEARYGSEEYAYGKEPNEFFQQYIEGRPPGKLLLPAEGEGRNAVFAARQGWRVTAFDYSHNAFRKALALALEAAVTIQYEVATLRDFHFPKGAFELVGLFYAHLAPADRRYLHQQAARCLLPGGAIVLEAFARGQMGLSSGGPRDEAMLYRGEDLQEDFHDLEISFLREESITLREGRFHKGEARVIRMIAQKN